MKTIWRLAAVVILVCSGAGLRAEDTPPWDFEIEESEVASFEAPVWLERDFGWLFTCRITVSSRYAVRPIAHMRFEGLDAQGETVWNGSKAIRRAEFKGQFGGGDRVFLRMVIDDAPAELASMVIRFDDGREAGDDSEQQPDR